jgi:polysaccharide pyruvyl transferase WcaK-like protein
MTDDGVVPKSTDLRKSADLDPSCVIAQPVVTLADVMQAILPARSVVAIRFHNVLAALKLCKPTIAISYSPKHDALMADMGVSRFCQTVDPLEFDLLIQRFTELESSSEQLRQDLMERNAVNERLLNDQFAVLSATLFPVAKQGRPAAKHESSRPGIR